MLNAFSDKACATRGTHSNSVSDDLKVGGRTWRLNQQSDRQ